MIKVFDKNGNFFARAKVVKHVDKKMYVKYVGDYERFEYGYFDFDKVFDLQEAIEKHQTEIIEE